MTPIERIPKQIRFPDVYGIDMAKLGDLAAFKVYNDKH